MKSSACYLLLTLFFLSTAFGQLGQWQWQNPKPTGNDLTNVRFANSDVGWFVGINGTIFKTTNGGKKWFSLPSPPGYAYSALYTFNADTLWIAACGYTGYQYSTPFKLLFSSDGGNSWEVKVDGETFFNDTIPPRPSIIRDLCFVDFKTGFAVGDSGFVLKTTDAGSHWMLLKRPTIDHINAVQFFDSLNGYIAGGDFYSGVCDYPPACPSYSHGTIMKTTNGGNTWQVLYHDTLKIHDIYFLTPSLGWATGTQAWDEGFATREAHYILKTTDGGLTWSYSQLTGSIFWLQMASIYFADENHGWAVGLGGAVERTTDGGSTWILSYPVQRPEIRFLNSVTFIDTLHGYSVGTSGVIIQTNDGGLTWQHYDSWFNIGSNNSDVHFINPDTGWIVSNHRLYRTTDKGEHWENQNVFGWRIDCSDGGNCWAVAEGGSIVHTSNAGNTWMTQTSGTSAWLDDVKFLNSKIGWSAGEGVVLKTTNGGDTWLIQRSDVGIAPLTKIVIQDSLKVWIYRIGGSIQTKDGGTTWSKFEGMIPVFFLNQDTGWASGWRTFDGGKTWESLGVGFSNNSKFVNANRGWDHLLTYIIGTHDGGYTWGIEVSTDVYHALYGGMHFVDSTHGWAVGMGGTLLRYGYPELITSVPNDHVSFSNPEEHQLYQNYPNPFNPRTRIQFTIREAVFISLKVYNILGMEIATLVDEKKSPGHYQMEWNIDGLPSGVYFYRLTAGSFAQTKKMVILR